MKKTGKVRKSGVYLPNDERGVAMITVLLILVLMSLIMVTSTNTVITEKQMNRSNAIFEQNFFLAESAALEGIQKIDNETTEDELLAKKLTGTSNNKDLLVDAGDKNPKDDREILDLNDDDVFDDADITLFKTTFGETSELDGDTRRMVTQLESGDNSSLKLGQSRLYEYMSYGMTQSKGANAMIKIGFKKRL